MASIRCIKRGTGIGEDLSRERISSGEPNALAILRVALI